jgi:hypothetical protein
MSLASPHPCSAAPGGGAPLSWPESNVIPEETLLVTEADSLPHDTSDLLDAILSDNFNPLDLLL